MRKILLVWSAFAVCAALVLGAMAWLTRGVLAAERERAAADVERRAAEARADLEERTRLALWRMDAAGAAIMLRENGRAVDVSPQPGEETGEVLLRFDVRRGGPFVFPALESAGAQRAEVEARIARFHALLASHPLPGGEWFLLNTAALEGQVNWAAVSKEPPVETAAYLDIPAPERRQKASAQLESNTKERFRRARAIEQALDNNPSSPPPLQQRQVESVPLAILPSVSSMHASWLGDELMLLRQISNGSDAAYERLQGVWIDWQVLAAHLLREIPDLLPNARLEPAIGEGASGDPLTLVSFPLRLIREASHPPVAAVVRVPFGMPLRVAWFAVGIALIASALLAAGIMRLSERRASFVSAVTHELRTPLTTFRLYSELLERGVVREEKRGDYLRVLSREADRLTHLVENVLAFSRIENGGGRSNLREITPAEMLGEMRTRFEDRLATAGMRLEIDTASAVANIRLKVDTAVVEHILFNLIDNAAKYAAGAEPPMVCIDVTDAADGGIEIGVCDHGPGIAQGERRRIFRPFHKSADAAAESRPGVGLGLALSRRLAGSIGGSLDCRSRSHGACFVLRLPRGAVGAPRVF
jgi:signal transduction histidine kinase